MEMVNLESNVLGIFGRGKGRFRGGVFGWSSRVEERERAKEESKRESI